MNDATFPVLLHDDVIKWKHLSCYWPFVRGIHGWLVNSPHKGQWCRAFMLSLICAWTNGWINNCEAGDLRHHHAHYDGMWLGTGTLLGILLINRWICQFYSLWPTNAEHWLRERLVAWQHHAISWNSIHLSPVKSKDIHLREILLEIPQQSVMKLACKSLI